MGPTRRIVSYPISVGIHSLRPQGIRLYQTKKTKGKIYARSCFYDYTEDSRPSALAGIFFAFSFDNSSGAVPG